MKAKVISEILTAKCFQLTHILKVLTISIFQSWNICEIY